MKSIANKDGVSNDLIIGRGIDTYRSICSGLMCDRLDPAEIIELDLDGG